MDKQFQNNAEMSNSAKGKEFEEIAYKYFIERESIELQKEYKIEIGLEFKKGRKFDLGNSKILVECKRNIWTESGNLPSAKISVWNEAMYYFYLAPNAYKKILFALRDYNQKRNKTLVEYYIEKYNFLIPKNVIFYEYDISNGYCKIYDDKKRKLLLTIQRS
ncbi:MAG: hypothetical protein FWC26_04895 [Fibromonadales bacterium]|nr:hypothetical protein [Fibromonadales bacterium]